MIDKLKDLLLYVALGAMLIIMVSLAIPVAICNWLKGLFEKPKEKEPEQKRENGPPLPSSQTNKRKTPESHDMWDNN